jgi:hypothetical protein
MRFRRKPTEIEAVQFDGHPSKDPPGVFRRPEDDTPYVVTIHDQRCYLSPGDWIAPEPDGVHYYPIKDTVFRATYDPVRDPSESPTFYGAVVFRGVLGALREGHGRDMAWALSRVPSGYRTITGVADRAGVTALVTLAIHGDRRHLLDVTTADATTAASEIDATIEDVRRRYQSTVIDRRGLEPAADIATLASEMSSGMWVIPNRGPLEPDILGVLFEMVTGEAGARLLALWCARP